MIGRLRPVRGRRDDGAAAVEFALVFPILLIVCFAILVFGLALFTEITAQGTAREAARQAAVGAFKTCNSGATSTDLRTFIANDLGLSKSVVTNVKMTRTDVDGDGADPGDQVTISFSVPSDSGMNGAFKGVLGVLPGGGFILPNTFTVDADTRVEQVGTLMSC
jgi:Flp pilus assembly protein TadG